MAREARAVLLLLLGFTACEGPSSDIAQDEGLSELLPRIRTDSSAYALRFDDPGWTTAIGFTYRAGTDTVYIVNCNGAILMHLQKRGAEGWTDAWYAEGDGCLSPPIVVAPGTMFRGEVSIWGAEPEAPSHNSFRVPEIDGEYRLVWSQPVRNYEPKLGSLGDTIPLSERVSNGFRLERAGS
jgi:hypothetical protein